MQLFLSNVLLLVQSVLVYGFSAAPPTTLLTRVELCSLLNDVGDTRAMLREGLRRDHVVLVSLDDADQAVISQMWTATAEFFALPSTAQASFGPLFEATFSESHLGHSRLVGYTRDEHHNSFMDTRIRRKDPSDDAGCTTGSAASSLDDVLELLPRGIDVATTPGVACALADGSRVLFNVGMTALSAATAELDVGDVSKLVDLDEELPLGTTSTTVHRLVSYGADQEAAEGGALNNVAFAPHTDGTWFTVVPCAAVAGLEVMSSRGWLKPEEEGRTGVDVAVLTGDFLQSLSVWEFESATHRVIRPPTSGPPRHSAPMLMRSSASYRAGGLSKLEEERSAKASAASSQFSAARLQNRSAQCAKERAAEVEALSNN